DRGRRVPGDGTGTYGCAERRGEERQVARIAVVAGEGIGPEVVAQGRKALDAVLPGIEATGYDLGAARYHRTGEVLPDSVLDELAGHDAILLGAVGDPTVPPGVLERGLLLQMRLVFEQYVNPLAAP